MGRGRGWGLERRVLSVHHVRFSCDTDWHRHAVCGPLVSSAFVVVGPQMLHAARLRGEETRQPKVSAFIEKMKERRILYSTPPGSNDDWWVQTHTRHTLGLLFSLSV